MVINSEVWWFGNPEADVHLPDNLRETEPEMVMHTMVSSKLTKLELTEDEKAVRQYLMRLIAEADEVPCDTDLTNLEEGLPNWYDAAKFKRAQEYFANNRAGIFASNIVGLISLLAHHKGLQILSATGRSSTPETARKRYVSTILHTLSWYEYELVPGSKSWESLMRVRKMHLLASRSSEQKKLGFISQLELSITLFGFMGYALIRPHIFHIAHDNEEDLEAFVHMWAVIGYMLGIKDENNYCLLPLNLVRIMSQAILRYFILPAVQLESPLFKEMTQALLDGLKPFAPHMSYDMQMFLAKRASCVPGYQHNVDVEKEVLCRSILTQNDFKELLKDRLHLVGNEYAMFMFFEKIPVYTFTKNIMVTEVNGNVVTHKTDVPENIVVENGKKKPMDSEYAAKLRKYLGLEDDISVILTLVDYETEWKESLKDTALALMNEDFQTQFKFREKLVKILVTRVGRYVCDWLVSLLMWRFRRYQANQ